MLVLLRVVFAFAFFYCVVQARDNARDNLAGGDLNNAFWVALGVGAAMASSIVWAPYFGSRIADPIAGGMINSASAERKNLLMQLIRWCDKKGHGAWVRWLCFIEATRVPWLPTAYFLGLSHSRPGSWLEKAYAREVFKFNNAEQCMKAFGALQRHGIDPRPHASADINVVLMSLDRSAAPAAEILTVPPAPPPPPLKRDPRIKIGS